MSDSSIRSNKTDKTIKAFAEQALKELDEQDNVHVKDAKQAITFENIPINKESNYP